jgi:hypothetical protein
MALFGRAGDEPRRRALVRGFRFVVACDRFFIAELAPQMGRRRSGSQKSVEIRTVSSLVEFYVRAARPSRALPVVTEAPLSRVLSVAAPG